MKIDFKKLEETILPQFKGGEGCYVKKTYADDKVQIMLGRLDPGNSIGIHCHELTS